LTRGPTLPVLAESQVATPRHASAKTTLDTYGHLWPDRDDTSRAAVAAVYKEITLE
jgi:hypothetical protein